MDLGTPSTRYNPNTQKYNKPKIITAIATEKIIPDPEYLKIVRYNPLSQNIGIAKTTEVQAAVITGPFKGINCYNLK